MVFFWFSPQSFGAKYEFQHPSSQNLLFKCLLQEEFRQYGIDWNGPVGTGDDDMVEVPDTLCPFSDHILSQLRQSVHPNSDDGNYGIFLYINAVSEETRLLQFQN